ncbi:MAG TPA: hypothetical protein VNC79_00110, partial [Mycobacteriales bacterium]|nr:hypothetical protein [Mycobacteriales bacterium]
RAAAGSRELRAGGAAEPADVPAEPADVPALPAERPAGETAAEPEIPATPGWTAAPAPPTASRAGGGRGPGWETP